MGESNSKGTVEDHSNFTLYAELNKDHAVLLRDELNVHIAVFSPCLYVQYDTWSNEHMHTPKNHHDRNMHEQKHNSVIAQDAVAVYQPEAFKNQQLQFPTTTTT